MSSIEARITERITNESGQVQALTGSIGGVVFQARGIGTFVQNDKYPALGFKGRWISGKNRDFTPDENRLYMAEEAARSIADVSRKRGFYTYVDRVQLGSASAPIGIENEVKRILEERYDLKVGDIIRDSLACNGTVWALTQAAQWKIPDTRHVVVTLEHVSPVTREVPFLDELFGDGVGAMAFETGDISVLTTNSLFEQDRAGVITIPHHRLGTLAPPGERTPFRGNRSCKVIGDEGSVFVYRNGLHQPIKLSEGDVATMDGLALKRYFSLAPIEVMEKTLKQYGEAQRDEGYAELNPYGVIHQPSEPVLAGGIIKNIDRSDKSAGVANRPYAPGGLHLKNHIQHIWTPSIVGATLHHNNISGATIVFSLLAMVEAGLITKEDIMMTGVGVGNNITSTLFRFP
jgi:hypothetical protein